MSTSRRTKYALGTIAVASLLLAGCSNSQNDSDAKVETATSAAVTTKAPATTAASASNAEEGVTFTDGYVKAMPEGKTMTGIFGVFTNNTDEDVNVASFTASVDAGAYELHEVVDGVMQMKEGGFDIPAGQSMVLQPGHEHMMLLDVPTPILAGDTVDITVTLSNGETIEVADLPVRDLAAGEENYGGGMDMSTTESGMAEMSEMAH